MHNTDSTNHEPGPSLGAAEERTREAMNRIKERLAPLDKWIRTIARERPLLAFTVAAGLGYVFGRTIRRA